MGELVQVLEAAEPGLLDNIVYVLARQPVPPGDPPHQRLVLADQLAPGRGISGSDTFDELSRIAGEHRPDCRCGPRCLRWLHLQAVSLWVHSLTMASGR
jgi:hypothetical protein